ncbi:MAG TPA: hypothetical protein VNG53_11415, partial [Bacteroidia bacterium]|nr:hypothetical protein [Bacteroidia bacterium]
MKKTILSFLFFGLSLFALRAQNLVPNWSFEQHDSCPYSDGQIYFANGWFNIAYYPDYYNSCSSVYYSVPTTLDGYNFYSDTTGGGDAIIWTYSMYVPWITAAEHTPPNLRISFGCQLSTALQIGTKYYVSFAIRFVICNHSYDYGIGVNGACNKIGALFSTVSYVMPKDSESSRIANYKNSLLSIKNYAQVYTNSVISDTSRWVVISGSFIADSAYTYINIG